MAHGDWFKNYCSNDSSNVSIAFSSTEGDLQYNIPIKIQSWLMERLIQKLFLKNPLYRSLLTNLWMAERVAGLMNERVNQWESDWEHDWVNKASVV